MTERSANPAGAVPTSVPVEPPKRGPKPPQLLRGMKDILPVDQPYWRAVGALIEAEAAAFTLLKIDPPIVEATSLFNRSIGDATDIVEKEMYTFLDRGGDSITLRPEFTAGIARAYIEHGLLNQPQPVKLYAVGPVFRYDRPQAGRYRQHTQFGVEVIGDDHPVVDAELLMLLWHFTTTLGLTPSLQINSIGDSVCRPNYKRALKSYYTPLKDRLCDDCQRRFLKNPLRLLDCNVLECRELAAGAPQIVDHLCQPCQAHFVRVLEYLDDAEVPYTLNPRLVRGLDYYTRTTFEVWSSDSEEGRQVALSGGGRYDDLLEQLGGRPTPAIGFGLGLERLIHVLKERGYVPPSPAVAELFVAQLGEPARKRALKLFTDVRAEGFRAAEAFSKEGIKGQLEIANRLGVKFAVIIGQKEMMDDTILLRDMENGIQEVIDYQKILPEIRKRLSKTGSNGVAAAPGPAVVPPTEPAPTP